MDREIESPVDALQYVANNDAQVLNDCIPSPCYVQYFTSVMDGVKPRLSLEIEACHREHHSTLLQ